MTSTFFLTTKGSSLLFHGQGSLSKESKIARLQRKCACGGTPGPSGECEECQRKRLRFQPKLRINQPGDKYEQEADRVAEAVVGKASSNRSSISSLGSGSSVPGVPQPAGCSTVDPWAPDVRLTSEVLASEKAAEEPKKKEEETFQRKAADDHEASGAPPIVDEVLQSSGQPLDPSTRSFMEERFGYDFSRVRVHADARAAESASAVNALAYTVANHLVFAAGRYQQSTSAGQRLLAHELAHTIQQDSNSNVTPLSLNPPNRTQVRAADHMTERVVRSQPPPAQATAVMGRLIQRQAAPTPIRPTDASVCRIHFEHARTEFTDPKEFDRCMKAARGYLKGNSDTKVALYGFASEEGDTKFNKDLAQRRAETVQKLLGLGGLPRARLLAFGRGEDKTFSTLPENRRVEVVPFQKVDLPPENITVPKPKRKPTPKPSDGNESQCRVDVRAVDAGPTAKLAGAKHLFLVVTDKFGNEYGARGGPDTLGGFLGLIIAEFGRYESGKFSDWDPAARSLTVLSGPQACDKKDCIRDACPKIDAAKIGYRILGPNSNSVAGALLTLCGIPRDKLPVWAPGWEVQLFPITGVALKAPPLKYVK